MVRPRLATSHPDLFWALRGSGGNLGIATSFSALVHAPDRSGTKLAALVVCHTGAADEAERELEPFKAWRSPLMVEVCPTPYPVMNTLLDGGFPAGSLNLWRCRRPGHGTTPIT